MRSAFWQTFAVAVLAVTAPALRSRAQSADALIDKLVDKGILTVKEANQLREEADKNFNQAYAVKSGMPDWVTSLKFSGDVRLRYEGIHSDSSFVNPGTTNRYQFQNIDRFRYRLRFGAVVTMLDNLEAGFKLTSGEQVGTFGGNPLSGNQTFKGNSFKNFLWIDQAYGKWSPLKGPDWTGSLTIGKMEDPFQFGFQFDDMVIDRDYTPEGAALQLAYAFNDHQALKLTLGAFVLNAGTSFNNDPYFTAAQLRWDAAWNTRISSSLGLSQLFLQNGTNLVNTAVPNVNGGNTRNSFGALTNKYYPLVADAALTYTLESFPLYNGPFPLTLGGEYMYNLGATTTSPATTDFSAWNVGFTFGKANRRGTWEFGACYRWLGGDAWYEELVDDDFGAVYWQTPDNWASGSTFPGVNATPRAPAPPGVPNPNNSYFISGTNVKGYVLRFAYAPTDSLTFSLKWFLTELIRPAPATSESRANRWQLDATLRF